MFHVTWSLNVVMCNRLPMIDKILLQGQWWGKLQENRNFYSNSSTSVSLVNAQRQPSDYKINICITCQTLSLRLTSRGTFQSPCSIITHIWRRFYIVEQSSNNFPMKNKGITASGWSHSATSNTCAANLAMIISYATTKQLTSLNSATTSYYHYTTFFIILDNKI